MPLIYAVHILAGSLALIFGYVALYSGKGGALHRKSGVLFVYAMLVMCVGGATIALLLNKAPRINVPSALLTAYMVVTGITTVRPPFAGSRPLAIGGMVLALGLGIADISFAYDAIESGGKRQGIPWFMFVVFATVALLASAGDLRILRTGALSGARRLVRHLWRMCYALFVAAGSFFLGQAKVIPKPIRIPTLLALPVAAVIITMFYWLWRVGMRRSLRGTTTARAQVLGG
jgi:hypothetical protein